MELSSILSSHFPKPKGGTTYFMSRWHSFAGWNQHNACGPLPSSDFYGICSGRPKQKFYSEDKVGLPFYSRLTWAEAWQRKRSFHKQFTWHSECPPVCAAKGGEEGELSTWPFPTIKMLIWWSQRNKLNCLFQPSILPGINQLHPHGDSFWRG